MSKVVIDDIYLTNIANSIRRKASNETKLTPAEMSTAIDNIKSKGNDETLQELELVEAEGGAIPKFKNKTGKVEIWGWGEGPKEGYSVPRYLFEGRTYRTLAYGLQPPVSLNLSIDIDGSVKGIPTIVAGKFLAVRKGL